MKRGLLKVGLEINSERRSRKRLRKKVGDKESPGLIKERRRRGRKRRKRREDGRMWVIGKKEGNLKTLAFYTKDFGSYLKACIRIEVHRAT